MTEKQITSTEIGKIHNLSPRNVNKRLEELGWINQTQEGWTLTPLGKSVGGIQRKHPQSGNLYIIWTESLLEHPDIKQFSNPVTTIPEPQNSIESDFRTKFPAKLRTTDGHYVRSRAEMLIDNWLYMANIVHAYERKLPVEEEAYCDFYLPTGKVYLEFWGLENDTKYSERKQIKISLYKKYDFSLIEIRDQDIERLDDILPSRLLTFNIKTY
jgi:hypothetical protein